MTQPKAHSELALRWAVAIVGVPIVLGLLYVGGWALSGFIAAFAWLGARELYRLAGLQAVRPFLHLGALAAAALVLAAGALPTFTGFAPWALGILGATALLASVAALIARPPDQHPLGAVAVTVFGAMYAGLALACVPLLHAMPDVADWGEVVPVAWLGLAVVALPLATTWIGDAAAFFAGTKWGKAKILPKISPKKSWVGSWTGLAAAAASGALWYLVVVERLPGLPIRGVVEAALIGALLGVGAQVGDFIESLFKREAGVKDSGTFFPGHGGVLDRVDALLVNVPLAYATIALMEYLR